MNCENLCTYISLIILITNGSSLKWFTVDYLNRMKFGEKFGEKESEGAKWVQSGRKEFKVGLKETKYIQVELELVESSQTHQNVS